MMKSASIRSSADAAFAVFQCAACGEHLWTQAERLAGTATDDRSTAQVVGLTLFLIYAGCATLAALAM